MTAGRACHDTRRNAKYWCSQEGDSKGHEMKKSLFLASIALMGCWPPSSLDEEGHFEENCPGHNGIPQGEPFLQWPANQRIDIGGPIDWSISWVAEERNHIPVGMEILFPDPLYIQRLDREGEEFRCGDYHCRWDLSVPRLDSLLCPIGKSGAYKARLYGPIAGSKEGFRCSRSRPIRVDKRSWCEDKGL